MPPRHNAKTVQRCSKMNVAALFVATLLSSSLKSPTKDVLSTHPAKRPPTLGNVNYFHAVKENQ